MSWKPGDLLTHLHNPELGVGRVSACDGRHVSVTFATGATLRFSAASTALVRVDTEDVPIELGRALIERLARGDVDPIEDFANRLDFLHLAAMRETSGLGSYLGGRIRLFPHQLHVALRATAADPVRFLLADEVGLGKTVEACLILNRLMRTGRVERCLVAAPDTLTVQWLGELWRKHHQVFVLLDDKRLADVARDFGPGFNPFDAHRRVVMSIETLAERPQLVEAAVAAGIDLLVVDEAHHLRKPKGHPGNPAWRAIAPIAGLGRHVLLLTATPFEDDVHGFFRLLQMLRPADFADEDFEARLARALPLPPCTSSTRRADIGGLPPRVAAPVALSAEAWQERQALESTLRGAPATNVLERRRKSDRIRRGLASGAALLPVLTREEAGLRRLAGAADANDPRLAWLAAEAPRWKAARQKTLVFVAHLETLEWLRTALTHRAALASAAFHEGLSPARRDIEVAQFRQPEGPSLLISTECGGEGRNFEFCHRLVLFDLPWNPVSVEQRIGRLDRIGRRMPVEIAFFRPPSGIGADVAHLYGAIGLFAEPLAGLEPELGPIEVAIEEAALEPSGALGEERFASLVASTRAARDRIREAAYQELHRDRYRQEMAKDILARVPPELDALTQEVVIAACDRLGFHVEEHKGRRVFSIEFGNEALVDSLPGVPGGSSFLGTFDREQAVENEMLDFFAAGHPLVEGVLAHLEEGPTGRVARLDVTLGNEKGFGLLALYKDGPEFEAIVVDANGRERPEWSRALQERPLRTKRSLGAQPIDAALAGLIRRLADRLPAGRRPVALAAVFVGTPTFVATPRNRPSS